MAVNVNNSTGGGPGGDDASRFVFNGSGCNVLYCANCGKPKFTNHDWKDWACERTHYAHSGILFGGPCRFCNKEKTDHVDP